MEKKIKIPDIEIGEKVQEIFEQRRMKLSDLADDLGTVRQNVYRIFKKKNLDTGLLIKISEVLQYNFFHFYRSDEPEKSEENSALTESLSQLELAKKEIEYLKKIIQLMEEKTKLLQSATVTKMG